MKKGILIPILILIFLTLSCASASDLNGTTEDVTLTSNDDVIGENSLDNALTSNIGENGLDDTLSVSNEENLTATVNFDGTTFSQLQSKIYSSNEYDTIVLTKNVKQDGSSPILINKSITIDGNGFTIDGNKNGRMMTITGANVTLKNISFINGYDHEFMFGVGAIYWNAPNALLTYCNFTNIDGGHVGCVDWEGTNGIISYCNFKDCNGGYSNVRVVETALYTTIDHCTFDNCIDEIRCGGIEWWAKNGLLNNTRFINCRGSTSAVQWTASNGTVNNCSFIGNIHVKTVTISAADAKYGWSSSITYLAKLLDEKGNGIPNKQVTFLIGGKTYGATTNGQGIATISLSLGVGSYNVEISIPIKSLTKKITVVPRLTGNKNVVMDYLDGSSYNVRAIDDNGNPVGSGTVVKIKVNGKTYSVKTDKNGYAKLKIKLKPKTYAITATYKGYTVKNKIKIKSILKAKKIFKVKRTAKKLILKAKLKTSKGKAIKGKVIKFRFKGKTYKAKTNKKGIAKVKIKKKVIRKLKKGKKYKVKISYKSEKVISKVKVKK